jgi:hypothetical protein
MEELKILKQQVVKELETLVANDNSAAERIDVLARLLSVILLAES